MHPSFDIQLKIREHNFQMMVLVILIDNSKEEETEFADMQYSQIYKI